MLKNVYIKNIKGLRGEHTLNFEVKDLKQTQIDKENSIGIEDGIKIMKAPILIAKNASGKSTVLEAIDMVMYFENLNQYLKEFAKDMIQKNGRNLLSYSESLKQKLASEFFAEKDKEFVIRTDDISKKVSVIFANEMLREVKQFFVRIGESFNFPHFNEISKDSLCSFADLASNKIEEYFCGLTLFDSPIDSYFDFTEEFEIRAEDTKGRVRTINNKDLSSEQIHIEILNLISAEIQDQIILPIWDAVHTLSEVIEDSTGVLNGKEDLRNFLEPKNYREIKRLSSKYLSSIIPRGSHLFEMVSTNIKLQKNVDTSLRKILHQIDKELGQVFLEKILIILDKNISHIEKNGQNIMLINKQEKKISPEALSFGTRKILELINFVIENKNLGFIMIDEIENGLNISLIKLLYRLFEELNIQVISTTHNPSIIHQGVISPINAFINNDKSFVSARDILETKRPANLVSLFRPENYKNDFHIISNSLVGFSTNSINPIELDQLLDIVEEKMGVNA